MHSLIDLSLSVVLASSLASCTQALESDDLAGEAEDEVSASVADIAVPGATAYFAIGADWRACAPPECGGWYLDRLNRQNTRCHDGSLAEECYTPVLDWSEANLSDEKQAELLYECYESSLAEGIVHAVVRGRFEPTNSTTPRPELGRFVITEAWVVEGEGVSDGVFVGAVDNGLRCLVAPCPNITETVLNRPRSTDIAEVELSAAGLTEEEIGECVQEMYSPGGILVAGYRYTVNVDGRTAKGRAVTAAFERLADTE
jgi:hypothetical protein